MVEVCVVGVFLLYVYVRPWFHWGRRSPIPLCSHQWSRYVLLASSCYTSTYAPDSTEVGGVPFHSALINGRGMCCWRLLAIRLRTLPIPQRSEESHSIPLSSTVEVCVVDVFLLYVYVRPWFHRGRRSPIPFRSHQRSRYVLLASSCYTSTYAPDSTEVGGVPFHSALINGPGMCYWRLLAIRLRTLPIPLRSEESHSIPLSSTVEVCVIVLLASFSSRLPNKDLQLYQLHRTVTAPSYKR